MVYISLAVRMTVHDRNMDMQFLRVPLSLNSRARKPESNPHVPLVIIKRRTNTCVNHLNASTLRLEGTLSETTNAPEWRKANQTDLGLFLSVHRLWGVLFEHK